MFKCIKGNCLKSEILDNIISALENQFGNLSSNKVQDGKLGNNSSVSDGLVFKLERSDSKRSIFLRIKKNVNFLVAQMSEEYIPSETEGTNGTFSNLSSEVYCTLKYASYTDTIETEWSLTLSDDCFILHTKIKDIPRTSTFMFFGWCSNKFEIYENDVSNYFLIAGSNSTSNSYVNSLAYKMYDGTYNSRSFSISSTIASTNPQLDGRFLMSPLIIKDTAGFNIGMLELLYAIPNINISDRDIITSTNEKYVAIIPSTANGIFPGSSFALRYE